MEAWKRVLFSSNLPHEYFKEHVSIGTVVIE
jgi:hypothetical protein